MPGELSRRIGEVTAALELLQPHLQEFQQIQRQDGERITRLEERMLTAKESGHEAVERLKSGDERFVEIGVRLTALESVASRRRDLWWKILLPLGLVLVEFVLHLVLKK